MPKVKVAKASSPALDMTPMVDLAFLLVTFFMLTATVRVDEPVVVDAPSSTSEKLLPTNVALVTIDKDGKAFYTINDPEVRTNTLEKMGQQYNITFTDAEKKRFGGMTSFGMPMNKLKEFIMLEQEARAKVKSPGIPMDSLDNQLGNWIQFGRIEAARKAKLEQEKAKELKRAYNYEPLRFAIKADAQTNYIAVKEVIEVFKKKEIFRFNLITNLEQGEE